jgi:DNA primase
VTWDEVSAGVSIEDFRLDNVRRRLAKVGDLWKPLLQTRRRADLYKFLRPTDRAARPPA